MPRKRGDHNKPQETKRTIIEYVLNCDSGRIDEPTLRAYLKEKFGITESKNIKMQLKSLEKMGCIKKEETSGSANWWFIDNVEHLKQIIDYFKMIPKNEHAINILAKQFFGDKYKHESYFFKEFVEWFKNSPTFFDLCLHTDMETLCQRWSTVWRETADVPSKFYMLEGLGIENEEQLPEVLKSRESKAEEVSKETYLFNWDSIPGNDNEKLVTFLRKNFGIVWVETANIEKIDDDRVIKVYNGEDFFSLRLNDENTIDLKIDDGAPLYVRQLIADRTGKFIVKMENNKRNIYKKTKELPPFFWLMSNIFKQCLLTDILYGKFIENDFTVFYIHLSK